MEKRNIYLLLFWLTVGLSAQSQSMQWLPITGAGMNGTCTSASDCDADLLCYALEYTPGVTGTLTSYTTGFFIDCVDGQNPVAAGRNTSCVMSNNSNETVDCGNSGKVLFTSSGNSGNIGITAGTPVILHQVCFNLSSGESTEIEEETTTDLTVSIDLAGGGATSEFPAFANFEVNHNSFCNALAVDFLSFQVSAQQGQAQLDWVTSAEKDNDYFSVEWSANGVNFHEIGTVIGSGTTQTRNSYGFRHQAPKTGTNFYRIKTIEFGGAVDYSEIRSLNFNKQNATLNLFPNPTDDKLIIDTESLTENTEYEISIWNQIGQRVYQKKQLMIGENFTLSLGQLRAGVYIIKMEGNQEHYIEQLSLF